MDIRNYNRSAWNKLVAKGDQWTVPVTSEQIGQARNGNWEILLTPSKSVPRDWFGNLTGADVLCLASGGGQQGPILAAAGANVTVFDNSPDQLGQDRSVADRDGLQIDTVEGDMRDLSHFPNEQFDLIFHACSNSFIPDPRPVWHEAFRVLRPGGYMLSGFSNPFLYVFDYNRMAEGELIVRHSIPYSDLTDLTKEELQKFIDDDYPLCFGHSLEDQIGGQTDAGFMIVGMYEDTWKDDADYSSISEYISCFAATRSRKPA